MTWKHGFTCKLLWDFVMKNNYAWKGVSLDREMQNIGNGDRCMPPPIDK